jgi:prevent-host-death family protein
MTLANVDEIKQNLPAYLERVEAGETVVITQAGKPIAELKPLDEPDKQLRPFGLCAGEFTVPADFDDQLPESVLSDFEAQ